MFNLANYTAEYAAAGFKIANLTQYFGEGGNASVLKAENITKDLAKFFSNFGLGNVSNESTGNVTAINQLLNDAGFTSFNLGNVSNKTYSALLNESVALWNMTFLTGVDSRILLHPRDANSSLIIGYGLNATKNVSGILFVICSAAVFGSLNATVLNAS